jgi:hypothetical protein
VPRFALVLLLAVAEATPGTAPDPLAAMLERQTQALFDALTRGDKAKWDKVLAPDLVYVSEDGIIQRGPDQRVTGFLERRESWDVHWKRMDDRK